MRRVTIQTSVRMMASMSMVVCAVSCGEQPSSNGGVGYQTAVVYETDGRVSLYSGWNIADKLAHGDDLESPDDGGRFLRLRVPLAMVESATASPSKRIIISLEEPQAGVDILFRETDFQGAKTVLTNRYRYTQVIPLKNTTLVPSQPWLSGHAQVLVDDAGQLLGGTHFVKYTGTLPMSSDDVSWGMVDCSGQADCPALRYSNPDPCQWPALPSSWTVQSLMDPTATLDTVCGRH